MLRAQVALEAEINSVKHAKDIRREFEKQNQTLKDENEQLRSKYKTDSAAVQKLQDEVINLEKAKGDIELQYKQLQTKCDADKKNFQVCHCTVSKLHCAQRFFLLFMLLTILF